MCMDYNGGVQFMNSCNESELFKSANICLQQVNTEFEKPEEYQQNLLSLKSEYNKSNYKYVKECTMLSLKMFRVDNFNPISIWNSLAIEI